MREMKNEPTFASIGVANCGSRDTHFVVSGAAKNSPCRCE
jgi:hypothetical protein